MPASFGSARSRRRHPGLVPLKVRKRPSRKSGRIKNDKSASRRPTFRLASQPRTIPDSRGLPRFPHRLMQQNAEHALTNSSLLLALWRLRLHAMDITESRGSAQASFGRQPLHLLRVRCTQPYGGLHRLLKDFLHVFQKAIRIGNAQSQLRRNNQTCINCQRKKELL